MPITKTNKKKDGKQGYRVRVNYTAIDGTYKQVERTAYGKAEAIDMERRLLKEVSESTMPAAMTVRELFEEYIQTKAQEVRETTLDKTRRNLEYQVLPQLGHVRLEKLNTKLLQGWKNALGEKDLKLTTKQNYYTELNAMLRYAVKRGYLPKNPLDPIGNFREIGFTAPEEVLHYYTAEEYLRFSAAAKKEAEEKNTFAAWANYVFFSIAFYTGMRKGEINALRWSDLNENYLSVRRSVTQKLKGKDRITPPKNKTSYRTLQAPEPLLAILQDHKARQQAAPNFTEEFYICGATHPIRDTTIDNANRAFSAAASLPHIRIHDFRHTHATLLINEGINIQEIARRLGHNDVQITWQTYAHLYPREEERAVRILNGVK